jgi:GTP-binding protein YchF
VAAIVHVVRCFEDDNVVHVEGSVDPVRDAELIETELLLADLDTLEKSVYRLTKLAKKEKSAEKELDVVSRLKTHCDAGNMARTFDVKEDESPFILALFLLTRKPILYVANVDENEITQKNNLAIRLCGKIEQEIAVLDDEGKAMFLEEYNLPEPGLNKLIHTGFNLLGLETYFTGGPTEVRAWTIKKGASAPEAAGEIHTDFQKGFIKAEIIKYNDLVRLGSEKSVKDAGLAELQGKDYIVQNGDCIYFHFNI